MLIDSLTKLSFGGNSKMSGSSSVISNTGSGIKFGNNSAADDDEYNDPTPVWPPQSAYPPKPSK